jgi:hypothetical protein
MREFTLLLTLLSIISTARADDDACRQARDDALAPVSKAVQATMRLVRATAAGCTADLKEAWAEFQSANSASEEALHKVEIACGPDPSAKKPDHKPIEDLIRLCDEKK